MVVVFFMKKNYLVTSLFVLTLLNIPVLNALIFNPIDRINKQNMQLIVGLFSKKKSSQKVPFDLFIKPLHLTSVQSNTQESQPQAISFKDVAGINEILDEINEVISYIKEKEKYQALGAQPPRGILLAGQPGTGKTLIAKAIAQEAGCSFFYESGSAFIEQYVGVGAARIRKLFEEATKQNPAIIFIDEIDAIARKRANSSNDEQRQTLNQLLCLMDGFNSSNSTIVIAATNCSEILDPALLRSGRFDRIIKVPLPNKKSRQEILELYIKKLPSVSVEESFIEELAQQTQGLSGADLNNLVNQATFAAAKENATVVTQEHFSRSLQSTLKQRQSRLF